VDHDDVLLPRGPLRLTDARGTGAGRALIEHARAWAEASGCSKLYWLTHETNTTARALYDRVAKHTGFVHYEIRL